MAYYNKIGLLIFNDDQTKFLVVEKHKQNVTDDYIMPGGQTDEDTEEETIVNEIREELDSEVDLNTLHFIGNYTDVAAGKANRDVAIKLYQISLLSKPKPSSEINKLHWLSKKDIDHPRLSPVVRNKIFPDLISREILK